MRRVLLLAAAVPLLAGGCVYTKGSLGTPKDRIFEEAFLGTWEPVPEDGAVLNPEGPVTITRRGGNGYAFKWRDPTGVQDMEFHLLKLGGAYFAELHVEKGRFVPLRLTLTGDRLRYEPFDDDWVRERAARVRGLRVTDASVSGGGALVKFSDLILEGAPKDLQAVLVRKALADPKAFRFYGVLRRPPPVKSAEEGGLVGIE